MDASGDVFVPSGMNSLPYVPVGTPGGSSAGDSDDAESVAVVELPVAPGDGAV